MKQTGAQRRQMLNYSFVLGLSIGLSALVKQNEMGALNAWACFYLKAEERDWALMLGIDRWFATRTYYRFKDGSWAHEKVWNRPRAL